MEKITVFTPTYNRADLLSKGYSALKRQTNKDFVWFIVDDGSTDDTKQIVEKWIENTEDFQIKYFYKENGGLHTAYNTAIENLYTELAVCVDSDDYLVDTAIEEILDLWAKNDKEKVAGIIALDCYENGEIIGDKLPDQEKINLIDLLVGKYKINNGDRKLVVRSQLYKSVAPQKVFYGEKNFNPHYMHLQISQKYDFVVCNKPLCVVEYQNNGMSANMLQQYWNSPNSFVEIRKLYLSFGNSDLVFKVKNCIHYISSYIMAKKTTKDIISNSPCKILTLFLLIPGRLLYLYIKKKVGK